MGGEGEQIGVLLPAPSSHNGQTGLGQTASAHSSSAASRESTDFQRRENTWVQNGAQGGA